MTECFPEAFLKQMQEQLKADYPAWLAAMAQESCRGIRMNPLKPVPADRVPGLLEPIPWEEQGWYLAKDSLAGNMVLHEAGAWYLQEPSAMVPAAVLNAQPGELVLDLCSAPGGKATQCAARMQGKGLLVCNEPVPKRAQILSRNIERLGITNAVVVSAMPEDLARKWPGGFDAVQVDAPCSGEGMFRRHPETRSEWTEGSPAACAQRQAAILDSAARLARPGGRIVYSTCTMNRTENQDTVAAFLQRHPDFCLERFSLPGIDGSTGEAVLYPHELRGEGQFVALLRRAGDEPAQLPEDRSLPKPDKSAAAAFREAFPKAGILPDRMMGTTLIALPFCPDIKGIRVFRCGLHLGELKGKRFEPDHAWAVSCNAPAAERAELSPMQAEQWLQGETIPCGEECRGWILPCLEGLPLGWGKASGGMIKNHYPKGLRRQVRG